MKVFGRRNKSPRNADRTLKLFGSSSSTDRSPFKSKSMAKGFSVFSLLSPRNKGFVTSPVSAREAGDKPWDSPKNNHDIASSDAGSDIVHHSVQSLGQMSSNMTVLEARTFGTENSLDSSLSERDIPALRDNNFPDRAEAQRTKKGPSAVLTRHASTDPIRDMSSTASTSSLSEHWMINYKDLSLGRTIGHSSFGMVTIGKLNGTKVAVKTIPREDESDTQNNLKYFSAEAEVNCKLRHPNIVLFMGICVEPTKICIVTELMSRGNVRDLLVSKKNGALIPLELHLRVRWALDTAQGMAYLHSLETPMIHRDLKTTNLLVDRGMNVKICDFGLSRLCSDEVMSAVGTVHFAAPEVLVNDPYTEKADLFSFGTVMWELYTRDIVFKGRSHLDIFTNVIEGNMPEVDDGCDQRYRSLMEDCWKSDPNSRPTFRDVIDRLSVLVEEHEEE